jgi:hypothetical protein
MVGLAGLMTRRAATIGIPVTARRRDGPDDQSADRHLGAIGLGTVGHLRSRRICHWRVDAITEVAVVEIFVQFKAAFEPPQRRPSWSGERKSAKNVLAFAPVRLA